MSSRKSTSAASASMSGDAGSSRQPSRIPRLTRKPRQVYLAPSPSNAPTVVPGPDSPALSHQGVIAQATPTALDVGGNSRRESTISAREGSVTATSLNGADPNSSAQAIKSPTFSNAETVVGGTEITSGAGGNDIDMPNRLNSVQSSYSPTETERSHYTSNTGGRARNSLFMPSGFSNLWRPRSSGPATAPSNGAVTETESIPPPVPGKSPSPRSVEPMAPTATAPSIAIHRARSTDTSGTSPEGRTKSPLTAPDEAPRSFFDSDSDSDSDRYQSPILSEAQVSSAARPALVEHKSSGRLTRPNSTLPARPSQYPGTNRRKYAGVHTATSNPGPSISKASQLLGSNFRHLHELTPATERDQPLFSHPITPPSAEYSHPTLLVPGMHAAAVASGYARNDSVSAASANTRNDSVVSEASKISVGSEYHPAEMEAGPVPRRPSYNVSSEDEELDVVPSPRHLGVPSSSARAGTTTITFSSPLDPAGLARGSVPKRTASAPLPRRTERIRTDDLVVRMGPGSREFRESVVSTPYPTRNTSLAGPTNIEDALRDNSANLAGGRDRDDLHPGSGQSRLGIPAPVPKGEETKRKQQHEQPPSPWHVEHDSAANRIPDHYHNHLHIRLTIANHPTLTRLVSIPLHHPPSSSSSSYPRRLLHKPSPAQHEYDHQNEYTDRDFFIRLRREYHSLIGPVRHYLTARTVSNVVYAGPGSTSLETALDDGEFLTYFLHPNTAGSSKKWIRWARTVSSYDQDHTPSSSASRSRDATTSASTKAKWFLGHTTHLLPIHHSHNGRPKSTSKSKSKPSESEDQKTSASSSHELQQQQQRHLPPTLPTPRLLITHHFSATRISLSLFTVLALSVTATILWTLIGLPRGTGQVVDFERGTLADSGLGWRNAAGRLQTGLVLGIAVAILGLVKLLGWLGLSWVVL